MASLKRLSKLKICIIAVLIIIFFAVLNLFNFANEVKNFFYLASAPIQITFWGAGDRVSDFFEAITRAENLKKENEKLEFKIKELFAEMVMLRELKKENQVLREALDIGLQKEFKMVFAQITGKDIAQDSVLINKGLEDGISKDMPVVTQHRILVGRISNVYDNFSRIMLISNKESAFSVNIQDTKAIARGRGAAQLLLDFVPHNVKIREGDKVVTTALEGIFPKGLLIGYLKNIKRLDVEPFQQAEIQLAVDIKELRYVFVITDF